MKSERRHELQENVLANYLGQINQAIEPYSKIILAGVIALLVAVVGYSLYSSKAVGERSDATLGLLQESESQDPEALEAISTRFPGTPAAAWAELQRGSQLLAQGSQGLFVNRQDAEVQLEDAKSAFKSALSKGKDKMLRSRANYGIARAAESLGQIDEAVEGYKDCIKVGESEEIAKACQDRITSLGRDDTKDFLAWFADQDFTPADPSLPPSLPSGNTLPDLPDLNLPALEGGDGEVSDTGVELPEATTDETAAAESDEPETEQPTNEQESMEMPTELTPANDPPAEPATEAPPENTDVKTETPDAS
ncbi:hypothetical protein CA13_07980 [Planctomycetes bacterium CA13]|uniref:Tetratricopeptide repeat-like domain-containing protein n=1 Tax=Novipirellula herctigrandis TaxID=2527986 RepID=A0A5C5YWJ4_9BACT|nr:hypothetical protein CA13_07980 [Planctomycetes bacterium CA13]